MRFGDQRDELLITVAPHRLSGGTGDHQSYLMAPPDL